MDSSEATRPQRGLLVPSVASSSTLQPAGAQFQWMFCITLFPRAPSLHRQKATVNAPSFSRSISADVLIRGCAHFALEHLNHPLCRVLSAFLHESWRMQANWQEDEQSSEFCCQRPPQPGSSPPHVLHTLSTVKNQTFDKHTHLFSWTHSCPLLHR